MLRTLIVLSVLVIAHAPRALSQSAPELRRSRPSRPIAVDCKTADGAQIEVKPIFAEAASEADVDEPPVFLEAGRRPPAVTREGRHGTVRLEFVIDADGVVIPCTVAVVHTDHPALVFSGAVVIRRSRYRPAQVQGFPVAVRVQQSVVFH